MSAYKFYGPHVGILWAKGALLREIDFPKLVPAPDYVPENAETGTQNQEGMVGAAAAIDFLASLGGFRPSSHGGVPRLDSGIRLSHREPTRRESLRTAFATMHTRNS